MYKLQYSQTFLYDHLRIASTCQSWACSWCLLRFKCSHLRNVNCRHVLFVQQTAVQQTTTYPEIANESEMYMYHLYFFLLLHWFYSCKNELIIIVMVRSHSGYILYIHINSFDTHWYLIGLVFEYSGPCILRPPIEPEKYFLKLKVHVVLKLRDNYIESIRVGSLVDGLKIEGFVKHVKWRGLKLQGPLYW